MNSAATSAFRLIAILASLFGLALASAPSQAISVVGSLGWQPVPAVCSVANNVRFEVLTHKLRFECGPSSVQFSCAPAGPISYNATLQRLTVTCASNTVTGLAVNWTPTQGGTPLACSGIDFDFDTQEQTVSYFCSNSPSQRRICYASGSPPTPDFEAGTVDFGYCPDAAFELIGHSGFESGENWRPTFGVLE